MVKRFKTPVRVSVGSRVVPQADQMSPSAFTTAIKRQMTEIEKGFENFVNRIDEVTPEILVEALKPSFEDSQRLVPEDTGKLKESGYLEVRKFRGRSVAEIGYGRSNNPEYAIKVHEDLDAHHAEGKSAKFLEISLIENAEQIRADILTMVKGVTGV